MLPSTHKKYTFNSGQLRPSVKLWKNIFGLICCCCCYCSAFLPPSISFQDEHRTKKKSMMAFGSKCCLSMALKSSFVDVHCVIEDVRKFFIPFFCCCCYYCCCGREGKVAQGNTFFMGTILLVFLYLNDCNCLIGY